MHLATLLSRVSDRVGVETRRHHLQHAIRLGVIPKAERQPSGYRRFNQTHIDALCDYMQTHSRTETSDTARAVGAAS